MTGGCDDTGPPVAADAATLAGAWFPPPYSGGVAALDSRTAVVLGTAGRRSTGRSTLPALLTLWLWTGLLAMPGPVNFTALTAAMAAVEFPRADRAASNTAIVSLSPRRSASSYGDAPHLITAAEVQPQPPCVSTGRSRTMDKCSKHTDVAIDGPLRE